MGVQSLLFLEDFTFRHGNGFRRGLSGDNMNVVSGLWGWLNVVWWFVKTPYPVA